MHRFAHGDAQPGRGQPLGREPDAGAADLYTPRDFGLVAAERNRHHGDTGRVAFWVAPMPPCVTAQHAWRKSTEWGTNRSTRAFGGTSKSPGSPDGRVATTNTSSPASAASAAATSRPSSWNSEDVVTSTRGRSIVSSQAGAAAGGS